MYAQWGGGGCSGTSIINGEHTIKTESLLFASPLLKIHGISASGGVSVRSTE